MQRAGGGGGESDPKRRASLYHERHPVSARNRVQMANVSQTQRPCRQRWFLLGFQSATTWLSFDLFQQIFSLRSFGPSFLSCYSLYIQTLPLPLTPNQTTFSLGFSTKPSSLGAVIYILANHSLISGTVFICKIMRVMNKNDNTWIKLEKVFLKCICKLYGNIKCSISFIFRITICLVLC